MKYNQQLKYKEICELMNDYPRFGGKSRKDQITKWQKQYDIERIGYKYIIKRKLTNEEQQLLEKDGKFLTYIQNLLVWLLEQQDNHEIRLGYRELFEYMNIVNGNYYNIKHSEDRIEYVQDISEKTKVDLFYIENSLDIFYEESNTILKEMMRRSLNSMQRRRLIIYSRSYRLYKNIYIPESKIHITEKHECTDEEVSQILQFYVDTMQKFGLKEYNYIYVLDGKLRNEFYHQIDDMIFEKFGYNYHREIFKIILAKGFENEVGNPSFLKKRLNYNVQERLNNSNEYALKIPPAQLEMFIKDLISME